MKRDTIGIDDYDDPAAPIDLDSPQAVEAFVRLGTHVPPDIAVGRPLMAIYRPADHAVQFVTANGVFESHPAHAERLASIGGSVWAELTCWTGHRETSRVARRMADFGPRAE